jgi:hypothetical protein
MDDQMVTLSTERVARRIRIIQKIYFVYGCGSVYAPVAYGTRLLRRYRGKSLGTRKGIKIEDRRYLQKPIR